MLTYGIPPEFRGGVHLFIYNRHTPSGQSRVYRVTQLRTDGVHCRESAGTGPVNLKVVPNECCLGRPPCVLCCVFPSHSFWTSSSLDVPAGVTQEEGHTGFFIHLLSAVDQLIFASLSHTHYWYEVGMLKVPVDGRLNKGPRLQRKHEDENEAKQNKT